jgi:crotonobetainyl-CoA:carnitine CoA-transferase CaiB-like acyl-CoA transferase
MGLQAIEQEAKFINAKARRDNFIELTELLEKTFKTKARAEWLAVLEAKGEGMAFSPIYELSELSSDPQVMLNGYITEVDHPTMGKTKMVGFPMKFNKTPAQVTKSAPIFGQHTEEVLMDLLGYSWTDLEKLRTDEVI